MYLTKVSAKKAEPGKKSHRKLFSRVFFSFIRSFAAAADGGGGDGDGVVVFTFLQSPNAIELCTSFAPKLNVLYILIVIHTWIHDVFRLYNNSKIEKSLFVSIHSAHCTHTHVYIYISHKSLFSATFFFRCALLMLNALVVKNHPKIKRMQKDRQAQTSAENSKIIISIS